MRRYIALILLLSSIWMPAAPDAAQAQSGKVRNEKEVKKKDAQEPVEDEPVKGETIKIETSLITIPITVRDKKSGGIYQGLKSGNFAVYEDGVKQEISNFAASEAPFTLVMLLEYSRQIAPFRNEIINPAGLFVTRFVRPKDQVAIVAYDVKPAVLNDFTDDPAVLGNSIGILIRNLPAWSESNLFDALKFVIQGGKLDGVEYGGINELQGNAAIILVSSGLDTFSKINYSQALKLVEGSGIPIYSIGIGNLFFKLYEDRMGPEQRMTWLQSANQLRSFSQLSGGVYFPVTFQGELPTTMGAISTLLRSQYSLAYTPTNTRREGKKRKIEVFVDVDADGQADNKKLTLNYRQSYQEPKS